MLDDLTFWVNFLYDLSNILTSLLQLIVVAIVVKAVPNTNLSSIDPISTTITPVGNGNHDNFVRLLQGNSPPWVSFCSYVSAGIIC